MVKLNKEITKQNNSKSQIWKRTIGNQLGITREGRGKNTNQNTFYKYIKLLNTNINEKTVLRRLQGWFKGKEKILFLNLA